MRALGFALERSSFVRRLDVVSHHVNIRPSGVRNEALISLVVAVAKPREPETSPESDRLFVMAYLEPGGVRFGTLDRWQSEPLRDAYAVFAAHGPPHFAQFATLDQLAKVLNAATADCKSVQRYLAGDNYDVLEPAAAELLAAAGAWPNPPVNREAPPINRELLSIIEWHRRHTKR